VLVELERLSAGRSGCDRDDPFVIRFDDAQRAPAINAASKGDTADVEAKFELSRIILARLDTEASDSGDERTALQREVDMLEAATVRWPQSGVIKTALAEARRALANLTSAET
jgi:hypothetical protein